MKLTIANVLTGLVVIIAFLWWGTTNAQLIPILNSYDKEVMSASSSDYALLSSEQMNYLDQKTNEEILKELRDIKEILRGIYRDI